MSKVAICALVVAPVVALPASQSFGWCRVHMPAPLLRLVHQKYFLPSKDFTNALSSLLSFSLGALFFHAHLSDDFFFCVSFAFFCSLVFFAAGFFSFVAVLFALSATPFLSFFNELISAVMATIFSCSSVSLPHVFSSSRSRASYLFSAHTMRSSAVYVALPSSA